MFFWDMQDQLIAMLVNVSCPSQEVKAYGKSPAISGGSATVSAASTAEDW